MLLGVGVGVANNNEQFTERYWRTQAQETRLLAERIHDTAERALVREVASNYDKLADMAAIRDRLKRGLGRRLPGPRIPASRLKTLPPFSLLRRPSAPMSRQPPAWRRVRCSYRSLRLSCGSLRPCLDTGLKGRSVVLPLCCAPFQRGGQTPALLHIPACAGSPQVARMPWRP